MWAIILIWAGLMLLAENVGLLAGLRIQDTRIEAWPVILIGAGVILLIEIVVRLLVPAYRRPMSGTFIFAAVLIGAGLGNLFGWVVIWPLIIIAIGVSLLLRGLFRRN